MNNQTLFITQNAPFVKLLRVDQSNGSPLDLTGYTSYMVLMKYVGSSTRYQIAGVHESPTNGIIKLSIASDSTDILPEGLMHYSIYLQPPTGDKMIVEFGVAKIIGTA